MGMRSYRRLGPVPRLARRLSRRKTRVRCISCAARASSFSTRAGGSDFRHERSRPHLRGKGCRTMPAARSGISAPDWEPTRGRLPPMPAGASRTGRLAALTLTATLPTKRTESGDGQPRHRDVAATLARGVARRRAARGRAALENVLTTLLVELAGFDRVVLSRVVQSRLVPVSVAFAEGARPADAIIDMALAAPIALEECEVEARMMKRGEPVALGTCPEPTACDLLGARSYLTAMVSPNGGARGFVHASRLGERPSQTDRDLLWSFVTTYTVMLERQVATDRLRRERELRFSHIAG